MWLPISGQYCQRISYRMYVTYVHLHMWNVHTHICKYMCIICTEYVCVPICLSPYQNLSLLIVVGLVLISSNSKGKPGGSWGCWVWNIFLVRPPWNSQELWWSCETSKVISMQNSGETIINPVHGIWCGEPPAFLNPQFHDKPTMNLHQIPPSKKPNQNASISRPSSKRMVDTQSPSWQDSGPPGSKNHGDSKGTNPGNKANICNTFIVCFWAGWDILGFVTVFLLFMATSPF